MSLWLVKVKREKMGTSRMQREQNDGPHGPDKERDTGKWRAHFFIDQQVTHSMSMTVFRIEKTI